MRARERQRSSCAPRTAAGGCRARVDRRRRLRRGRRLDVAAAAEGAPARRRRAKVVAAAEASKPVGHVAMPADRARRAHLARPAGELDREAPTIMLTSKGLNTLEIDVKDERGEVGFDRRRAGARAEDRRDAQLLQRHAAHPAARTPPHLRDRAHRLLRGSDPRRQPAAASRSTTTSGGVWTTAPAFGWTNEYDPFVWNYLISLSKAAARLGFDEIQYDYVRFPTDGTSVRRAGRTRRPSPTTRRSTASSRRRAPRSSRSA